MKLSKLTVCALALTACSAAFASPKVAIPSAQHAQVYENYVTNFKSGEDCYKGVASAQVTYGFIAGLPLNGWADFVATDGFKKGGMDLFYKASVSGTTKVSYLQEIGLSEQKYTDFLKSIAAYDEYYVSLRSIGYDHDTGYQALFDEQYKKCATHFNVAPLNAENSAPIFEEVKGNAAIRQVTWDALMLYLNETGRAADFAEAFK